MKTKKLDTFKKDKKVKVLAKKLTLKIQGKGTNVTNSDDDLCVPVDAWYS